MKGQHGSSTLEFIFCAPVLLIVLYAAMEINERIEQRVNSVIATGSAAWLTKPDAAFQNGVAAQDLIKADILGTSSQGVLQTKPGLTIQNGRSILTYSENKLHSDAYQATVSHISDRQASERAAAVRASQRIGNTGVDPFAHTVATFATNIIGIYRLLVDPPSPNIPTMFPDTPIEHTQVAWTLTPAGTTNLAVKGIEELAKHLDSKTAADLPDTAADQYRLLAQHVQFLRRNAGYHNNQYNNEALIGMAFGDNGEYKKFVDQCFMNLEKRNLNSQCGESNGFYDYLNLRHNAISTMKTFMSCVCTGLDCPAKIAVRIIIETAKHVLEDIVTNSIEKILTGAVNTAIEEASNKIEDGLKGPKDQITNQVKNVQKNISDQTDKAVDQVFK